MLPKWNDEAASVFKSDVYERKQMTYGSKHKKNGSKSKKCTLPSDYLTKKEKEKMNGEVKKYIIGKPIDADTFKSYPAEIKQEYIITTCAYYQASCYALAGVLPINGYHFDEIVRVDNLNVSTKSPGSFRTYALKKEFDKIIKQQCSMLKSAIDAGKLIPITWDIAKRIGAQFIVDYIERLQIIYGVPITMIAHMMCTTRQAISGYIKHNGLELKQHPYTKYNYDLFIKWAVSDGELDPDDQKFVNERDPYYTPSNTYDLKEEDILAAKKRLEEKKASPITGRTTINGSIDDVIGFLNKYKNIIDMKEVSVTIEF